MKRFFGRPIDVVAFGATHRSLVAHHRGVLLVNPGSPTLPVPPGTTPGTVAVLELRAGVATVEILRI
jgi:predicted phosphodiesterase